MQVTVEVPEALARQMAKEGDIGRQVLESVVIEQYRTGHISRGRLAELLELSFWQSEAFLRRHGLDGAYAESDLDADVKVLERAAS